ncbi:hypothetical protein PENTCL1PPCAC_17664, partial [Pristionchus entomophagus]
TPKMLWLLDKSGWGVYFFSSFSFLDRIALLFFFILVLVIIISKYISNMSSSSKSQTLHTTAIRNLILQFIVFSTFLTIPIMIILVRLMFVLDSGSILFFISESILCYHGLANSIIAVSFNSNFRRAIR